MEDRLDACYTKVLRALTGVAGSLDRAEDAFQEALVELLEGGPHTRVERLEGWLYVVGVRRLRRRRWRERLETPISDAASRTSMPDVTRVAAAEFLRLLSAREREIVVARYYLDLSYREIAEFFGISIGTASSTVSRALDRIRRAVGTEAAS